MKKLLVIIEHISSAKKLLEKSLAFQPEHMFVVVFEQNLAQQLEKIIHELKSSTCNIELIVDQNQAEKNNTESVITLARNHHVNAVVVQRPEHRDQSYDFSFEKGLLKRLDNVSLLICGNKRWKSNITILGTVDIEDDSKEQNQLNSSLCEACADLTSRLSASLHMMSVINVSRVSQELDLVEPSEVLSKKGKAVKTRLQDYIKNQHLSDNTLAHVTAGSPYNEIPSIAKKIKADLIVIGNVGRTGLKGLFIGNTAEKILSRLHVDALIIKK